ncbi:MAG: hypothetical protein ACFFBJ_07295 [Promethearchaeota archaeon]
MKKCHVCGATINENEKLSREYNERYYCIFCLDDTGKPPDLNQVYTSIKRFWLERDSEDKESIEDSS